MSRIYDEIKHGHKIGIGQDISEKIRNFAFNNPKGFEGFNAEVHEDIKNNVMDYNYFIGQALEDATPEEKEQFAKLIKDKVIDRHEVIANQRATPKQIYYYQFLSKQLEENPQQISTNKEIHREIDRLNALQEYIIDIDKDMSDLPEGVREKLGRLRERHLEVLRDMERIEEITAEEIEESKQDAMEFELGER